MTTLHFVRCCSFCGRNEDTVQKLVASPEDDSDPGKRYICSACVGVCIDILGEDAAEEMKQRAKKHPNTG